MTQLRDVKTIAGLRRGIRAVRQVVAKQRRAKAIASAQKAVAKAAKSGGFRTEILRGLRAVARGFKQAGLSTQGQARVARLQILDSMAEAISDTRDDLSEYAPRMISMKIPTDKIGAIIGPGGSVIRGMIDEFGVTIDVQDDGTVVIGSPDKDNAEKALDELTI